MPIYGHEISSGLRRGFTALPLFGSAATNTVVLGLTIVLVVVAISLVFGGGTAQGAVRSVVYSLPVVFLLLYLYAGSVAATVEGNHAGNLTSFISRPVGGAVAPRSGDDIYGDGPPPPPRPLSPEFASVAPVSRGVPVGGGTTVSAQLAGIERNLAAFESAAAL